MQKISQHLQQTNHEQDENRFPHGRTIFRFFTAFHVATYKHFQQSGVPCWASKPHSAFHTRGLRKVPKSMSPNREVRIIE